MLRVAHYQPDGGGQSQERAQEAVCAALPEYHRDHHLPALQVRKKTQNVWTVFFPDEAEYRRYSCMNCDNNVEHLVHLYVIT